MKNISIAGNSDATLIAVASLAFIGLFLFLKNQAAAAAKAVVNVNKGTQYDGTGAVGTLGNAVNQLSGGAAASVGTTLGGWLYNTLNPYDPNNNGPTSKQVTLDNSASATAAASDTFTPSPDFGANDPSTW